MQQKLRLEHGSVTSLHLLHTHLNKPKCLSFYLFKKGLIQCSYAHMYALKKSLRALTFFIH